MKSYTDDSKNSQNDAVNVIHIPEKNRNNCHCNTYEIMGYGQHCPCDHKDPAHLTQSGEYKMRIVQLYQLYDIEAEAVAGPIFNEHTAAPAIRKFHAIFQRENTLPHDYPQHFVLRHLGTQDEVTGRLNAVEPVTIATGAAWATQQENK